MSTPPAVAYYSPRMGFLIQAGTDKADYGTIIDALLKTDGASGLVLCTEATKPTTNNFPGKYIRCSDSGKHYYLDATGTFTSGVYSGGTWQEDFYITAVTPVAGNVFYTGTIQSFDSHITSATGGSYPKDITTRLSVSVPTASTNQRYTADVCIEWDMSNGTTLNSYPILCYLVVDSTEIPLGAISWATSGTASLGASYIAGGLNRTFKYAGTLPTSGSHTFNIRLKSGHNTGTNSTYATTTNYNLVVTLSS